MSTTENALAQQQRVSGNALLLSFIPIFGGLAVVQESKRLSDRKFTNYGWAVFVFAIFSTVAGNITLSWIIQIGLIFWLKSRHDAPVSEPEPLQKIDFNSCSKHELVHVLNLPIVYANDIDLIRNEGYLFTHIEELIDIAGIPEEHVLRIAPQLIFSYDAQKDDDHTWRQMNFLTASEMESRGVEAAIAQKIVEERTQNGDYRSAVDVKRRTKIAFRHYQALV